MNTRPFLLLLLIGLVSGCQAPRGGLTWGGVAGPPPPSDTASRPPRTTAPPRTSTPAPSPRPDRAQPEQARPDRLLRVLDLVRRSDPATLPIELSGANKPNGPSMRYRQAVPEDTPAYVDAARGTLELFIADPTPEGWLGFYRGACDALGDVCDYRAVLFDADGTPQWDLDLNPFLLQDRYVEIQDIRYHEGKLYFNEACATYSRETEGQCSYLVRVDPERREEDWRTPPPTSNNIFIIEGDYVIAGYGFTSEEDALYLIERETGRIAARAELDSAHEYLEVQDDRLYVVTYNSFYTFAL
jgi:hypothetical protein